MSILVTQDRGDAVEAVLSSGHPENRLDADQVRALDEQLRSIEADDPGAILLRGDDGFCAGRVTYPDEVSADDVGRLVEQTHVVCRRLEDLACPTIAYVDGAAGGIGASLALRADVVIMHRDATMEFREVDEGFAPFIALDLLLRRVPRQTAFGVIALDVPVEPRRAESMGLAQAVGDLDSARRTLERFARSSSVLRACKGFIADHDEVPREQREALTLRRMRQELAERWL